MDPNEVVPLLPDDFYDPSEMVLIGSHMKPSPELEWDDKSGQMVVKDGAEAGELACGHMHVRCDYARQLHLLAIPKEEADSEGLGREPTLALVYAYGYEGHVYRLPKPRIMILHGLGRPYEARKDIDPSPI